MTETDVEGRLREQWQMDDDRICSPIWKRWKAPLGRRLLDRVPLQEIIQESLPSRVALSTGSFVALAGGAEL